MVEQLTEDEQVEALKKWWKENGRAIILGVIIGVSAIVGFWKWNQHVEEQALAASLEYDRFTQYIIEGKSEQIAKSFSMFTGDYEGTSYATLAALLYASYEYDKGNKEKTLEHLRWAKDHSGHEALLHVAQIRLARFLVSENKLDEAFALIDKVDEPAFVSQYAEIKGDVYSKRGEPTLASTSYQLALSSTELSGKQREYVQMKLDNLGAVVGSTSTANSVDKNGIKSTDDKIVQDGK